MSSKFKVNPREIDTEWLVKYHKIVVGLASLADCYSQGCDEEWLAMQYSLDTLAKLMQEDIDSRADNGESSESKTNE